MNNLPSNEFTASGIENLGDIPWGTHLCDFFDTKQDLLDILVPYFKAGLKNNEFCLWIISEPINVREAFEAIEEAVPGFNEYFEKGCIEILPHSDWYLKGGKFDPRSVINGWFEKLNIALAKGFRGMRVSGMKSWIGNEVWEDFMDYERELNSYLKGQKILVLCAYPFEKCNSHSILEVTQVHQASISTQLKKEIEKNDVTEKSLQNSMANFKSIFDNTIVSYILLDTEFNFILFNEAANVWAKMAFGKEFETGMNFLEIVKEEQKEELVQIMKDVLSGKHISYETSYPIKDNSIQWEYIRFFPIKLDDGKSIGVCISAEDITKRKVSEVEKEKITLDIIKRLKTLEQYTYIVSHNLRAPVANIIGFSNLLSDEKYGQEEKKTFSEQLEASVRKLDEVIRDLGKILQVERDVLNLKETVSFADIVESIKYILSGNIEKEQVVVNTDFKVEEIISIKSFICSIFYNLITNSIKYRNHETDTLIEISSYKSGINIILKFKDNGSGIDLKKNGDKIFGLYKQFHSDIKGKGMGLFMVKSQVETLGGTIRVDSETGKGTTFIIEFKQ